MISKDRKRNRHNIERKPVILISFEGKTEKKYFSHFGGRNYKYNLELAPGNQTDPINIVNRAINGIKENDIDIKNGDKVYCIIDTDMDSQNNKTIEKAIALANKKGIKVITSSPCIELWFYLHFEYIQSPINNKEVLLKLKAKIPNYEKGKDIFEVICKNTNTAIKNAKKLEKYQIKTGKKIQTVEANPHSQVYEVIDNFINN